MNRPLVIGIVVAAALVGGIAGGAVGDVLDNGDSAASTADAASAATTAAPAPLSAADVYRADAPGVVVITDTQTQAVPATPFGPSGSQKVGALGSGFVLDANGDIVTNAHVVQRSTGIRVGLSGGASYPATIVGTDPSTDIAVLHVTAPANVLHPLALDTAGVDVGDAVYAIGNPFGLERTMTAGIVSATGRDISSPNGLTIPNAIQTDAPINHGNSGGPLIGADGRVLGVSSQIEGGTVDANVGIGFAVGSATVQSVAQQLVATGHAQHPWLGVQLATIDPTLRSAVHGLPAQGAAVMRVVPASPAARAGLRAADLPRSPSASAAPQIAAGDTIVGLDGAPVTSADQLTDAVAAHAPGDHIALTVSRGGAQRNVSVTLGNAPATP